MAAPLPLLSEVFEKEGFERGASSFINLWSHGLRLQRREKVEDASDPAVAAPRTVLSPDAMRMTNLVPMDAVHPLYHNAPSYILMRHQFLLDSMLQQKVDLNSPELATAAGLSVVNMNNNTLVFKRDANGRVTVNGAVVESRHELSDGTLLLVLDRLLFNHEADVKAAFGTLMEQEAKERGPGGMCFHGGDC